MAQIDCANLSPISAVDRQAKQQSMWRRWFGQANGASDNAAIPQDDPGPQPNQEETRPGLIRRVSRKVVPGLPRAQTFKRQQAEVRNNLEPVQPTKDERRAASVDRRFQPPPSSAIHSSNPRSSAPDFVSNEPFSATVSAPSRPGSVVDEKMLGSIGELTVPEGVSVDHALDTESLHDTASMTTSQYDAMIHEELERVWILNLSMHFRDKSKREKFFVTYREKDVCWRRVTVSLDYRGAPDNSLEMDLWHTRFQRDKSAKIYEAIRESLVDIQFYDTVTNLKLQTTEGRLHVHVVEDVNEIINYPTTRMIQHLRCRRIRESDIGFEAHMSGFVYKVRVNGQKLIKKEVPGPDTVDEFLYEINALSQLAISHNIIHFYGVVVDEYNEYVKGLLISYAEQGALIDVIYEHDHNLAWTRRERWARQIVEGLSEVHEAGFVQGDFTLSNIVIDDQDNAKIIDINRRGCPVGWEPPEVTPLIECNQRISMYIGVKSDLYQLGMVLWALAEQEDEPEAQGRPLTLSEDSEVPGWYRTLVSICLAENPRNRMQAIDLLRLFPQHEDIDGGISRLDQPAISVDDGSSVHEFFVNEYQTGGGPMIRTVQPPSDWNGKSSFGHKYVDSPTALSSEPYFYPTRGRSPPSPMPSNFDHCEPWWSHQGRPEMNTREGSFERIRSPSSYSIAPDEIIQPTDPENLPPQENDGHQQLGAGVADEPVEQESKLHQGEAVTWMPESKGDKATKDEQPGEDSIQNAHQLKAQQIEAHADEQPRVEEPRHLVYGLQNTDKQNSASRSPRGGIDAINTDNNKNPLFREAGNTEPESPRTVALVSRAAEIQNNKSTNQVLGTKKDGEDERIDSAIEMNSPTTPSVLRAHRLSASSSGANLPYELMYLGSGHDSQPDDAAIRRVGTGSIHSDDLVGI